jgi:calcineurin-like phosphoesterase family protein
MIEGLLDKDTTLDLATRVSTAPAKPRGARISVDPRVWLGALALRGSVVAENKTPEAEQTPKDRKSYIPRDLALSYLQARQEERTATGVRFAERAGLAHGFDYHFVTAFLAELTTHLVRRVRFTIPRKGPRTTPLASAARIVIVGDWGTGTGPALAVADQMRVQIESAGDREVHVVHLGDVYYAGTRWEARHRFLDHWPVYDDEAARTGSWCLNGNHDMYSAGEGLFDVILADDRFARQRTDDGQVTSEFHLRNEHWDVVGVDTSWKFHLRDVRGGAGFLQRRQRRWIADRLDGSTRRSLLLSHHQPFTREAAGDAGVVEVGNLLAATGRLRRTRGVDAWFWGHEHRLFAYGARSGIRYATCMGHGAVLEELGADVTGAGEAEFRQTFRDDDGDVWRKPGFTVVDLDADVATVSYVDMDGMLWRAPDTL